jgi:hypothetical protein
MRDFLTDEPLATPDGQKSGLNHPAPVTCGNLVTVAQAKFRRMIGSHSASATVQIDAGLKAALELPQCRGSDLVFGFRDVDRALNPSHEQAVESRVQIVSHRTVPCFEISPSVDVQCVAELDRQGFLSGRAGMSRGRVVSIQGAVSGGNSLNTRAVDDSDPQVGLDADLAR